MTMKAEKILDLDHFEDVDVSSYDQIRITIGQQRFRIVPKVGFIEVVADGPVSLNLVSSNWLEIRQIR